MDSFWDDGKEFRAKWSYGLSAMGAVVVIALIVVNAVAWRRWEVFPGLGFVAMVLAIRFGLAVARVIVVDRNGVRLRSRLPFGKNFEFGWDQIESWKYTYPSTSVSGSDLPTGAWLIVFHLIDQKLPVIVTAASVSNPGIDDLVRIVRAQCGLREVVDSFETYYWNAVATWEGVAFTGTPRGYVRWTDVQSIHYRERQPDEREGCLKIIFNGDKPVFTVGDGLVSPTTWERLLNVVHDLWPARTVNGASEHLSPLTEEVSIDSTPANGTDRRQAWIVAIVIVLTAVAVTALKQNAALYVVIICVFAIAVNILLGARVTIDQRGLWVASRFLWQQEFHVLWDEISAWRYERNVDMESGPSFVLYFKDRRKPARMEHVFGLLSLEKAIGQVRKYAAHREIRQVISSFRWEATITDEGLSVTGTPTFVLKWCDVNSADVHAKPARDREGYIEFQFSDNRPSVRIGDTFVAPTTWSRLVKAIRGRVPDNAC